jgi:hypothetical protein
VRRAWKHRLDPGTAARPVTGGERPAERGNPVGEALEPTTLRIDSSHAPVQYGEVQSGRNRRHPDLHVVDARVLDGVRDRLGADKPGSALDRRRKPLIDDLELHPYRDPAGQIAELLHGQGTGDIPAAKLGMRLHTVLLS